MKLAVAYFEVIPLCVDVSYTLTDTGVYIYETKKEIDDDILDLENDYKQQAENGERDPDDCDVDFYAEKVILSDTGKILLASNQDDPSCLDYSEDITGRVHKAMLDTDRHLHPDTFTKSIIEYVDSKVANDLKQSQ